VSPCSRSQPSKAKIKGLWIAAPINRAVDDKVAKSLLGESFKRQLKYDGAYSRITFICTKTDDISITEVSDSLDLGEVMLENWAKVDQIKKDIESVQELAKELKESKRVYEQICNDAKDQLKIWGQSRHDLESGKAVVAPSDISKKRKRSATAMSSHKVHNYSSRSQSRDDEYTTDTNTSDTIEELPNGQSSALTFNDVKDKITELRLMKRSAPQRACRPGCQDQKPEERSRVFGERERQD